MSLIPRKSRTPVRSPQNLSSWMERFFEEPWVGFSESRQLHEVFHGVTVPAVNISEDEKTFTVSCELPGLEEKDIDVQVMGNQLTISGERRFEDEKKEKEFHRVEHQYGSFSRTVTLPTALRFDQADAAYQNGILTIDFPKVEPTPSSKIEVKAKKK